MKEKNYTNHPNDADYQILQDRLNEDYQILQDRLNEAIALLTNV
jgi:hypothetical protein